MSTKTKRRPPVRVPPPPARQQPSPRRASPKVLLIAGGAVVAVAIAIVLAVTLSGGSSSSSAKPSILPGAADVQRMFKGIPQDGNTLGSPSAPVTMVEYVDLQCPYCREFETVVLPNLLTNYVRTGKVKIEQRLLAFIGPDSVRGRNAALAAGLQARQFNFSELLYFNQGTENTGWLDENMVNSAAASIPGLNAQELQSAQGSATVAAKAAALDAQAHADAVDSTPTILVGKTGTAPQKVALSSPTDLQSVVNAIEGVASAG
jgi:protein-disulfide isomerase